MTPSVIKSICDTLNKPQDTKLDLTDPEFAARVITVLDNRISFQKISQVRISGVPGCDHRFPIRTKNTRVLVADSPTKVTVLPEQANLDRWFVPPSMTIVLCPDWSKELSLEALLAIPVAHERLWAKLVREASTVNNSQFGCVAPNRSGDLKIDIENGAFALRAQAQVAGHNLHAYSTCFIGSELVPEAKKLKLGIGGQTEFMKDYGYLGTHTIDGYHRVALYSDYQRPKESLLLNPREMIHTSDPLNHGCYADYPMEVVREDERVSLTIRAAMAQTSSLSSVHMP